HGYVDHELYAAWSQRDPIVLYSKRLEACGLIGPSDLERLQREAEEMVEAQARLVIAAPWPDEGQAGVGVFAAEKPRVHVELLDRDVRLKAHTGEGDDLPPLDQGPP